MNTMRILAAVAMCVSTSAYADTVSQTATASTDAAVENTGTDWSGRYIGVIAANNSAESETGEVTTSEYGGITLIPAPGLKYGSDGMSYGVEAGYNFQANHLVYGLEVDASKASIDGHWGSAEETMIIATHTNWMASARGRLGFAAGNALFYVTGGIAGVGLEGDLSDYYRGELMFKPSVSETRTGWVDGVGAEFKVNQSWSIKAEYLRYDFGTETQEFVEGDDRTLTAHGVYTGDQARIGLNYRF